MELNNEIETHSTAVYFYTPIRILLQCNVPAMSHVTAKVSYDGAANYCWTVDQLLLDSWPTIVGHLAKLGDLDKYI